MLIQTRQQFEALRTVLHAANHVTLDTETTGLIPHTGDRLCGIATRCTVKDRLLDGKPIIIEAYFPFRHKPGDTLFTISENLPMEWLPELLRVLNKPNGMLRFHHAKFDLLMLAYEGYDFHRNPFQCTQIMSWLNCEWESHRLKDLHEKYVAGSTSKSREATIKEWVKQEGGSYANVPPAIMDPYACGDVRDTDDLYKVLAKNLEVQNLTRHLEVEYNFVRLLFEMEMGGIGIDLALCESLNGRALHRRQELLLDLGFDPMKGQELAHRLFARPPEGLGLPIPSTLTKTSNHEFPNGVPEMRKDWLSQYIRFPLVDKVLEYRALVKSVGTWFEGFAAHAGSTVDGRVHTTYNSTSRGKSKMGIEGKVGTVTGRLNSSNPNVHQIPREDESTDAPLQRQVKHLFIPGRVGYSLWEFDYQQIEVREAAGYANADLMIYALQEGVDPHNVTAEKIGCSRQTAKHATYTTLYGGQASTLAHTIERLEFQTTGKVITYSLTDAQEILNAYFDLYPGFRVIQNQCSQLMKERGYLQLWDGRRRHYERWFDVKTKRWVDNTHKAFNSLIQGGAASIIKQTMLFIPTGRAEYRIVNQVHDSLWIEIANKDEERIKAELRNYMEWPSRDARFKVPFPVDIKLLRRQP